MNAKKAKTDKALIKDGQSLDGARYTSSGTTIPTYDDGFGPLWISRNSIGLNGVVRARTWEDAYSICEDEFFPEADETIEEIQKEYGFRQEHKKVVADPSVLVATEHCAAGERFERYPEDYPDGKLAPQFIRWETIETPDPDAWMDNELFQEGFGFRNNGPNERDANKHGIYSKDLNGDWLDPLTAEMIADLGITLDISQEEEDAEEEEEQERTKRFHVIENATNEIVETCETREDADEKRFIYGTEAYRVQEEDAEEEKAEAQWEFCECGRPWNECATRDGGDNHRNR